MAASTPATNDSEALITTQSTTPEITAHATAPEKTVFVESDNHDAWIATDLVVDLER